MAARKVITEILSAVDKFRKSDKFDFSNATDRMDVSRRFASKFSPEDLKAAAAKATGGDKSLLTSASKDAVDFQKYMSEMKFEKGGVKSKRGQAAMNKEGFPEIIKTSKYDPKTKTYRKPKNKPKAPKKPEMMGGGMYKSKKHSYAAGGMVKDMKLMRSN